MSEEKRKAGGGWLGTIAEDRLNMNKYFEERKIDEKKETWPEWIKNIAYHGLLVILVVFGVTGLLLLFQTISSPLKPASSLENRDMLLLNENLLLEIQKNQRKTESLENKIREIPELIKTELTDSKKSTTIPSLNSKFDRLEEAIEKLEMKLFTQNDKLDASIAELENKVGLLLKKLDKMEMKDLTVKTSGRSTENLQEMSRINPDLPKQAENITRTNPIELTSSSLFKNTNSSVIPLINVASVFNGASVDNDLSSSTNLTSFFGGNQVEYVILDRRYLPDGTAWCSTDRNPVLTINLANYSRPSMVSYQHAEWDGEIPVETPKEYDVMACLDSSCKLKRILARSCKYLPSETQSGPEKSCDVPSNETDSLVNKVQFVFLSNHGNVRETCVNLVRVYAEDRRVPEIKTEKQLKHLQRIEDENKRTCDDSARAYYKNKWLNPSAYEKHCVSLYSKNCCSTCPECCEECTMEDTFNDLINRHRAVFGIVVAFLIVLFFLSCFGCCIYFERRGYRRPERIKIVALYSLFLIVFVLGIFGCYRLISAIQGSYQKTETLENLLQDFMARTQEDASKTHEMIENLQAQITILSHDRQTTKETDTMNERLAEKKIDSLKNLRSRVGGVHRNLNIQGNKTKPVFNIPSNTNASSQINVASVLLGASVDNDLSSSTGLTSFFGGYQEGYVILERPYLPEGTAWCSYDKEPVLTINLANYSKPIAVSYQHAEWNGAVPDEAPKEYAVMACLDSGCSRKTIIACNCHYLPTEDQSGPEQKCVFNYNEEAPLINKIQFLFRRNHGNAEKTCVNLVRVFAEDKYPVVKTEKQIKHLQRINDENERTCADWANLYYNKNQLYVTYDKHCVTLYSKNCCTVCPECCEECTMEDTFGDILMRNIVWVILGGLFLVISFISTCMCCLLQM